MLIWWMDRVQERYTKLDTDVGNEICWLQSSLFISFKKNFYFLQ